ncbi:hypothetical protein SKAU_G00222710 [Synaphobranchus kaupii]|uniref:Uncharacterized protein n=1 Tax=Synaphobranchus kaupii TaxID=118154 RepID=A0A9Q1FBF8_SYNKA|nr:hypothetical protein SKAU_G00222710 [Synaphobranchus kaupii]
MYLKRNDEMNIAKKASFMDIKVRVTSDVLGEYKMEVDKLQKRLDEGTKEVAALNLALQTGQTEDKEKNAELVSCQKHLKTVKDEITATETDMKKFQDQSGKEKAAWTKEVAELKQQLAKKSEVCAYVKKDSAEGMKLCDNPIPEPPKQVASKAEEPKAKDTK